MQTDFDGKEYMIGAKFKLKTPMLGVPVGSVGYVFNQYDDFDYPRELGVQIIFENGNYDGFSITEQEMFLEYLGYDTRYVGYKFKNVMQVYMDYRSGYWKWD